MCCGYPRGPTAVWRSSHRSCVPSHRRPLSPCAATPALNGESPSDSASKRLKGFGGAEVFHCDPDSAKTVTLTRLLSRIVSGQSEAPWVPLLSSVTVEKKESSACLKIPIQHQFPLPATFATPRTTVKSQHYLYPQAIPPSSAPSTLTPLSLSQSLSPFPLSKTGYSLSLCPTQSPR
ncbi:hypothetical protein PBY51_024306 [Eleginops maclovinus]|uniref:Uncharacterized protein n=1 Tax=Eleginops maclovinus TaxID=56733 RepID=A0AAN7XYD4_ELEMC|nr:hypothetical protein PBY51_024306 [Eleginops maclovinus]